MKIKVLWGFSGDAEKLGASSGSVRRGQEFSNVDTEYGHQLIGKGLAVEIKEKAEPKSNKQTSPKENK